MNSNLSIIIDDLISGKNLSSSYKKILKLLDKNSLFFEKAGICECLYRLKNDISYYKEEADVINYQLGNKSLGLQLYFLYLKNLDIDLFNKIKEGLQINGYNIEEIPEYNKDDTVSYSLAKLADRYNALLYIIKYFVKIKDYTSAVEAVKFIDFFESEITKFIELKAPQDLICIQHLNNYKNELSDYISLIKNHNDINRLAIKLNPLNEAAYLNILDDLITYNNYEQAVEFYNNSYANTFSLNFENSIIGICWILSDKFYARCLFFDSVRFQKIAIELELEK